MLYIILVSKKFTFILTSQKLYKLCSIIITNIPILQRRKLVSEKLSSWSQTSQVAEPDTKLCLSDYKTEVPLTTCDGLWQRDR